MQRQSASIASRTTERAIACVIALVALVAFWCTAYPTITWWDSAHYSTAAYTLGVPSPPGSLLLTLIGWPVSHIPIGNSPAHRLNLLAGVLAAIAVVLLFTVTLLLRAIVSNVAARDADAELAHTLDSEPDADIHALRAHIRESATDVYALAEQARASDLSAKHLAWLLGAAAGALSFAFSATTWEYAIKFTPYVLTIVFTALILCVMMVWWQRANDAQSWRWLALLAFLFGVDFSVHRTNAMLIPSALIWVLIRDWRALTKPRNIAAVTLALAFGLLLQLLVIPIARFTSSPINFNSATTLATFWDFVALRQFGGGFLFQLYPRNSPLFAHQAADMVGVLRDNFAAVHGTTGWFGAMPACFAVVGLVTLCRRDLRLGIALFAVAALHASSTVLYFNIPAEFFRTFDRHYLPVCMSIAVFVAYGAGEIAAWLSWRALRRNKHGDDERESYNRAVDDARVVHNASATQHPHPSLASSRTNAYLGAWVLPIAVCAVVPIGQFINNFNAHNASARYFARDYAHNALKQLPDSAIYFTAGDNDTYAILYEQWAEHFRTDVSVVNRSVLNMEGYPERLQTVYPGFPISVSTSERRALLAAPWTDTLVVVPAIGTRAQLGVSASDELLSAITLRIAKPTGYPHVLESDASLLDIVRTNRWRRPLTFAITGGTYNMAFLEPYGRMDGMYWRIVPVLHPAPNASLIRAALLQNAEYRGYADSRVLVDDVSNRIGLLYYDALSELTRAPASHLSRDACTAALHQFLQLVPRQRVIAGPNDRLPLLDCQQGR